MKLSLKNLTRGMKWWRRSNWASDYLNGEYYTIYQDRDGGLNDRWLALTVDRLARWRATRSRRPPNTKKQILARLRTALPNVRIQYERILALSKNEPSLVKLSWEDI